jgi:trigger factor
VLDEAATEGLSYTVGAGDLVDGIDDAITGLSAGESVTFGTTLVAGGLAGREADVTVTVQSVSERDLPEVDEDFAQLASEFDTVEELRADLAEKIRRVKEREQGAEARDKVLEALLEITDVPTPESIVDAEVSSRQHDAVHAFDHNEDALTAHVISQGQTREEFDDELKEGAVKSVKVQLLLDALAEANQVGVSQEEFTERVMYNSQRLGIAPDEYFSRLQEGNQLGAIFAEVRRGKALAAAVDAATVTNTSGEVLDVGALFGIETVEEEEALADELLAEAEAEVVAEELEVAEPLLEQIEADEVESEVAETASPKEAAAEENALEDIAEELVAQGNDISAEDPAPTDPSLTKS